MLPDRILGGATAWVGKCDLIRPLWLTTPRGWSNLEYSSSMLVLLILLLATAVKEDCFRGGPFVELGVEVVTAATFLWILSAPLW